MSDAVFRQVFEERYHHLGTLDMIRPLAGHDINSRNRLLRVTDSSSTSYFVLKEVISDSLLDYLCRLVEACAQEGLPVPKVYRDIENRLFSPVESTSYVLFSYSQGNPFPGTEAALYSLGESVGRLFVFLQTWFPSERDFSQYEPLCQEEISKVAQILPNLQLKPETFLTMKRLLRFMPRLLWEAKQLYAASLPRQLIHLDLHPDNVIFSGDQVAAILDFAHILYEMRGLALGYTLDRFVPDANYDSARVFFRGVCKHLDLLPSEITQVARFTRLEALRRVSYILRDLLHGDKSWEDMLSVHLRTIQRSYRWDRFTC